MFLLTVNQSNDDGPRRAFTVNEDAWKCVNHNSWFVVETVTCCWCTMSMLINNNKKIRFNDKCFIFKIILLSIYRFNSLILLYERGRKHYVTIILPFIFIVGTIENCIRFKRVLRPI